MGIVVTKRRGNKMRKLIVTAALMLAINTSPAYSKLVKVEFDCDFVRVEALKGVTDYKNLTIKINDGATTIGDVIQFRKWRDDLVSDTNMLTNVYNTFCK